MSTLRDDIRHIYNFGKPIGSTDSLLVMGSVGFNRTFQAKGAIDWHWNGTIPGSSIMYDYSKGAHIDFSTLHSGNAGTAESLNPFVSTALLCDVTSDDMNGSYFDVLTAQLSKKYPAPDGYYSCISRRSVSTGGLLFNAAEDWKYWIYQKLDQDQPIVQSGFVILPDVVTCSISTDGSAADIMLDPWASSQNHTLCIIMAGNVSVNVPITGPLNPCRPGPVNTPVPASFASVTPTDQEMIDYAKLHNTYGATGLRPKVVGYYLPHEPLPTFSFSWSWKPSVLGPGPAYQVVAVCVLELKPSGGI